MNWKEKLKYLESIEDWDSAIELMQKVIAEHPNDIDAAIRMNYLLMNLLVEEQHDESKHGYYEQLTKKYFLESYQRFSDNPEYLFFTGITACMSEWYFGIEIEQAEEMIQKAMQQEPQNILYQWAHYGFLDVYKNENEKKLAIPYAKIVLEENSPLKKILETKGAIGSYLLDIMTSWGKRIIESTLKL